MINNMMVSYIERLERLDEEKKAIQENIWGVKSEAKAAGFDVKMITRMMAERRMTFAERETEQALLEIYRAGCGLLDGTPLGDAARRRLMGEEQPPTAMPPEPAEAVPDSATAQTTAEGARGEGVEAFKAGARIIDNPYTAGDPRRAAWDEGFCAASGSDGMDIPEAYRRKPKKAKEAASGTKEPGNSPAPSGADAPDPNQPDLPMEGATPGEEQAPAPQDAPPAKAAKSTRQKPAAPVKKIAKKPSKAPTGDKPQRADDGGEAHP